MVGARRKSSLKASVKSHVSFQKRSTNYISDTFKLDDLKSKMTTNSVPHR